MPKDFCLIEIKLFLKEIIISHFALNVDDRFQSDAQIVKEGKYSSLLHVSFNEYPADYYFKIFDDLQNNLLGEINYNRDIGDKLKFENYLFDIKEVIDLQLSNIENDKTTNKLNIKNLIFSDKLKDFKLDKIYLDDIERFKKTFYDKMISFQGRLIKIPEYKEIHLKNQKSLAGNNKIEWKGKLNRLVAFYLKQIDDGLVETDRENLRPFLINNFTWKGKSLSENSIKTYLDPNKELEDLPKGYEKLSLKDFL
jgi:hypothetical protein